MTYAAVSLRKKLERINIAMFNFSAKLLNSLIYKLLKKGYFCENSFHKTSQISNLLPNHHFLEIIYLEKFSFRFLSKMLLFDKNRFCGFKSLYMWLFPTYIKLGQVCILSIDGVKKWYEGDFLVKEAAIWCCSMKNGALKNFAKFTEKHLYFF